MSVPRPGRAALLVCVLFLAAEIFAFAPLLHAHCGLQVGSVGSVAGTAAGSSGPLRSAAPAPPARDECPACRIASMVMVAQGRPPLVLSLPRLAQAAGAPTERRCWLTLDRACGRAPPRR
jgi:hypothetical protein